MPPKKPKSNPGIDALDRLRRTVIKIRDGRGDVVMAGRVVGVYWAGQGWDEKTEPMTPNEFLNTLEENLS